MGLAYDDFLGVAKKSAYLQGALTGWLRFRECSIPVVIILPTT